MSGCDSENGNAVSILVVEDNEVNQKVTVAMLQHFGIVPDIAENGQVAIKCAENKKYDLVFMDCQMPVMNGFETTEFLRGSKHKNKTDFKTQKDVIIVAMTANAAPADIEMCKASGMNDFIAKPVELEVIQKILEKWVNI